MSVDTSTRNDAIDAKHTLLSRLYTGTGAFEIVKKRRMWFGVAALIMAICIISIAVRGFTLGIDFEGGSQVSFKATSESSVSAVEDVFSTTLGHDAESVQTAGSGNSKTVQIRTSTLAQPDTVKLSQALADRFKIAPRDVNSSDVSSTWGGEVTKKAIIALVVFLVIVLIYITVRFDLEMSLASMAALVFDIVATAGVYSLVGFEVTPATVIGLLTILGFSLYDTVVVFDKVEENTRGVFDTRRRTYAEQANLAVNQTLMRSINTTVISILPILALMVIAVWLLGVGTLKDLGLIQLVGVFVGTFSSIFFATPLLATLKERRREVKRHTQLVLNTRAGITEQDDDPQAEALALRETSASQKTSGSQPLVSTQKAPVASRTDADETRATTGEAPRPTGKRRRKR